MMKKKQVSGNITALLVYQAWVTQNIERGCPYHKTLEVMGWFNEAARALNKAGYGNIALFQQDGKVL